MTFQTKPYFRKINYYETDKMGVTHHSNYIRFMEETRVDYLDQIGYSYKRMQEEGVISPVISVECEFKTPTTFGDELEIFAKFSKYTGVRFEFEYIMKNKSTQEIVFTGKSVHCFISTEGKPIIIKKQFPKMHEYFLQFIEK